MKIDFKSIFIGLVIVLAFGAIGYLTFIRQAVAPVPPGTTPTPSDVIYTNNDYGFRVTLPLNWQGYTVSTDLWTGTKNDSIRGEFAYTTGPLILIHNPKWTKAVLYQDIPVMVFTLHQWQELSQDVFHIGAAPIGPSELARNTRYVFALPARYNYAYPPGWEEVDQLLSTKPVKGF
jgi:hypothetical protein